MGYTSIIRDSLLDRICCKTVEPQGDLGRCKGHHPGYEGEVETSPRRIYPVGLQKVYPLPTQNRVPSFLSPRYITKLGLELPQGSVGQGKMRDDQTMLLAPGHLNGNQESFQKNDNGIISKDTIAD